MDEFKQLRQELFDVKCEIAINIMRNRGTNNQELMLKEAEIKKRMSIIKINEKLRELGMEPREEEENDKYKGR